MPRLLAGANVAGEGMRERLRSGHLRPLRPGHGGRPGPGRHRLQPGLARLRRQPDSRAYRPSGSPRPRSPRTRPTAMPAPATARRRPGPRRRAGPTSSTGGRPIVTSPSHQQLPVTAPDGQVPGSAPSGPGGVDAPGSPAQAPAPQAAAPPASAGPQTDQAAPVGGHVAAGLADRGRRLRSEQRERSRKDRHAPWRAGAKSPTESRPRRRPASRPKSPTANRLRSRPSCQPACLLRNPLPLGGPGNGKAKGHDK